MDDLDSLLAARASAAQPDPLDAMLQARAQGQPLTPTASPTAPAGGLPVWQRVIKGITDANDAGAQMLVHALPSGAVNAVNSATQTVNDLPVIGPLTKALNMVPATPQQVDQTISNNESAYQQARGDKGIDWARLLGSTGITAPLAAAMPGAAGVTGGAMAGALYGGISSPVTEGDYATGKLKQMGTGALAGGATTAAVNALARAISPTISPEVRTLMDAGVTPTPGQILGGGAKRVEDAATSIPVLGDTIKNAQRRSFQDLNDAAINRALDPIGERLPRGTTGREAIDFANTRLGDAYERVLSRMGAIRPDAQFNQDLTSLTGLTRNLPQANADQFDRIVQNEIRARIDANGVMTPQGMKAAESNLGNMVRGYLRSPDYDTRQMGAALEQAQETLRGMVQRVAPPQYAAELQNINRGWANFMRPQKAAGMLGAESGVFTPEQLQSAVKALDPSRNKGAFARGDALMQDLSEAGKTVMGNKVPDSGTPLRHAVQAGLGLAAGHAVAPGVVGAAAAPLAAVGGAAMLPYTATGQRLAAALLTQRPQGAQITAEQLRALAPYLGAIAVPALTK